MLKPILTGSAAAANIGAKHDAVDDNPTAMMTAANRFRQESSTRPPQTIGPVYRTFLSTRPASGVVLLNRRIGHVIDVVAQRLHRDAHHDVQQRALLKP